MAYKLCSPESDPIVPNTVELEERITNLLFKLKSDLGEKRYKGFKNEGVGSTTLPYAPYILSHYCIFFVSLQIHMGVAPIDSS